MANSNCLEGMACPKCESEGPFRIDVRRLMVVEVSDDGFDCDGGGDTEWDNDSSCTCVECDYAGTVSDFKMEEIIEEAALGIRAFFSFSKEMWEELSLEQKAESFAQMEEFRHAAIREAAAARVLVVVSGGVADYVSDGNVKVTVFDWDNYRADPEATGGVTSEFADLAAPLDIPFEDGRVESAAC